MITLEDCKQAGEYNYKGLSTDTKPTNCYVNSLFLELDTGIFYFFDGTEWKDISQGITLGESEPTGTITITENGIFDVHDYAEADVDVPAITPTGTISITENGTVDVSNYVGAAVSVNYAAVNFNLPGPGPYDIQIFPGTKYSFNGSTEQTSSTWQTLTMQGEVIGYIKVKDATVN